MYQGSRFDQVTGLYLFRHRNYSPSLGTWTSQDPAGYINGANTYQFVISNPVGSVDPSGELLGMCSFLEKQLAKTMEEFTKALAKWTRVGNALNTNPPPSGWEWWRLRWEYTRDSMEVGGEAGKMGAIIQLLNEMHCHGDGGAATKKKLPTKGCPLPDLTPTPTQTPTPKPTPMPKTPSEDWWPEGFPEILDL
jgi:RHS repeat-associated protein